MNQAVLPPDIWDEKDLEDILRKELGDFSRWYCQEMVETYEERERARKAREPREKIRVYDRKIGGLQELHQLYFRQPDPVNSQDSSAYTISPGI